MSKILIVTAEAGGNVPPHLAIAERLAASGCEVVFVGIRHPERYSWPPGVTSVALPALGDRDAARTSSFARGFLHYLHLGASRRIGREVRREIVRVRPDVVVVDCLMVSALRAAAGSGIPAIVLFHSYLAYWAGAWRSGIMGRILTLLGSDPIRAWRSAAVRLVVADRALDPFAEPSPIGVASWTGTTERAIPATPDADPLVLVSLSTTWFPGQAAIYRRIVAAFAGLPVRAIVTTGGVDIEGGIAPPPNVQVTGWAPHAEIIPRCALVICHGGQSTTMKALAHGVPVITIPLHPLLDETMVGRSVADAGAGRLVDRSASVERLRAIIAAAVSDPALHAAAQQLGARLRSEDGAQDAADRILALIDARASGRGVAPIGPGVE